MVTKNIVHSLAVFQWNTKSTVTKVIREKLCTVIKFMCNRAY